jgi:hypothetical protein
MCFAPGSGWQHNYSTKARPAGWANEQSMYSLMSMIETQRDMRNLKVLVPKENDIFSPFETTKAA